MSWYPNKTLYRRESSQSGKQLVSVYPESWLGPVISHDEWFSESRQAPGLAYEALATNCRQLSNPHPMHGKVRLDSQASQSGIG